MSLKEEAEGESQQEIQKHLAYVNNYYDVLRYLENKIKLKHNGF